MAQTHILTDGYGDYMTESAQWGRFSEKGNMKYLQEKKTKKKKDVKFALSVHFWPFCIRATIRIALEIQCLPYAEFSLNRPHWADSVIESPCPCVCVSVCLSVCAIGCEYPPTCLLSDCRHDCNMRVGNMTTSIYIQIADIDKSN